MAERRVEEKNLLYRMDGKKVILKIKQALEIGKMLFSFVQYDDNNKSVGNIDCYMDAEYFGAVLIRKILGEPPYQGHTLLGELAKEKAAAEKEGRQYPNAVWASPLGGKRTENGAVSRSFTIAPGAKSEVLFTANEYEAEESATGAFVAKRGTKPITTIRVPATYNDLIVLSYNWGWLENDYMGKKYSLENMKSDYIRQPQTEAAPVSEQPKDNRTPAQKPLPQDTADPKPAPAAAPKPGKTLKDAKQLAVKSCHELSYLNKSKLYVLQVITADGQKHAVYVNKSAMSSQRWPEFQRKAAVSGLNFVGLFLEKDPAKGDFELVGFPE